MDSVDEASPEFSDAADSNIDMDDSDGEGPSRKVSKAPTATGPKKTASEMYQKVSRSVFAIS